MIDLSEVQELVFQEYKKNGYLEEWTSKPYIGKIQRKIDIAEVGLFITEVAEVMEELRKDYIFSDLGLECADILIRVLNFMSRKNLDAETFILEKNKKNLEREKLHGKEV